MKKQLSILFLLMLTFSATIHCGGARGKSLDVVGEVESTTNNLTSAKKLDLYLDQIHLAGRLGSSSELHIMDATETQLLACTYSHDFHDALITFAEIETQFMVDGGITLDANTPIVIRFIERNGSKSCPEGYVGATKNQMADRVLSKQTMTYGELNTKLIEFPKVATVGLTMGDQASWPLPAKDSVADGVLNADQIKIRRGVTYGETSNPEWGLLLYQENVATPLACTDMGQVDMSGILYATMAYDFEDVDVRDVRLSDFDLTAKYKVTLMEFDLGRCQDLLDETIAPDDVEASLFGETSYMLLPDLLDDPQTLNKYGDFIRLTTR